MYVVLLWRPEAEDGDGEPFDGIEIGYASSSKEDAEAYINREEQNHPEWHFMLDQVTKS